MSSAHIPSGRYIAPPNVPACRHLQGVYKKKRYCDEIENKRGST